MIYDIAILGAGIHGAACADEASSQGYKVIVLEQYDQAGLVTSSKSSKLIHGGLRYLETARLGLVNECLHERKYLLERYPELVKLVAFHIPVYKNTTRRPWIIRTGLIIYSLFSKKPFKSIPENKWGQLDGLSTNNLQKVFQYFDAQTNDQLLTQAVMASARKKGAELLTNAKYESADCRNNQCVINYTHDKKNCRITCKAIINTTGPWVNNVLQSIQPKQSYPDIDLVLGTHIIIPGQLTQGMYYLESPDDKRAVFVMPWNNHILTGTTERLYTGRPEDVEAPEDDIKYLLSVYNHYFDNPVSRNDVIDAYAGLRVLLSDNGSMFSRSREITIHHNDSPSANVFTLYGGKLTTHRATAKQLLKVIKRHLHRA